MKLSDAQKAALKKHMEGYKGSDVKSHRMKMIGRMAKGMSLKKAMDDIGSSAFAAKNKGKKNAKNPISTQLLRDAVREYNRDHRDNPRSQIDIRNIPPSVGGDRQGRRFAEAGTVRVELANGQVEDRFLVLRHSNQGANRAYALPPLPHQRQAILNIANSIADDGPLPAPPPRPRGGQGGGGPARDS